MLTVTSKGPLSASLGGRHDITPGEINRPTGGSSGGRAGRDGRGRGGRDWGGRARVGRARAGRGGGRDRGI